MNLIDLAEIRKRRTLRCSSWDETGKNSDSWVILAGKSRVLANQ